MATEPDENMQALYSQLLGQLAKAKYPRDWWSERHGAIAMLRERSPRLFAELVIAYRAAPFDQSKRGSGNDGR